MSDHQSAMIEVTALWKHITDLRAQLAAARTTHATDLREIAERMDHFATAASDLNRQQMYAELRRQLANVRERLAAIEGGGK